MADRGDNNFMRYVYRGEEGEIIPREATHITVHEDCTSVRANAFLDHQSIVEIICHDKVEKIEIRAFFGCTSLRRVIMPGVKIVEEAAFENCHSLSDVECNMLEIIKEFAFSGCIRSLNSIDLPSARIVEEYAFDECTALANVKFGSKLERIEGKVFCHCESLERVTLPLKDNLITTDDIFAGCRDFSHVDLVEGGAQETIAALQLDEWRKEMNEEIDSINQILHNAGFSRYNDDNYAERKARAIRRWIRSVLRKINHYKAEHERILDEAETSLQLVLSHDILTINILPFLKLPSYTFEAVQDHEMGQEDSDDEEEE